MIFRKNFIRAFTHRTYDRWWIKNNLPKGSTKTYTINLLYYIFNRFLSNFLCSSNLLNPNLGRGTNILTISFAVATAATT